jgi:hypothetical protein
LRCTAWWTRRTGPDSIPSFRNHFQQKRPDHPTDKRRHRVAEHVSETRNGRGSHSQEVCPGSSKVIAGRKNPALRDDKELEIAGQLSAAHLEFVHRQQGRLSWRPLPALYRRTSRNVPDRFCGQAARAALPPGSRCPCIPGICAQSASRPSLACDSLFP